MADLICNKYSIMLMNLKINPITLQVEPQDPEAIVNWVQRDGDWIELEVFAPDPAGLVPEPKTPWPQ